MKVAHVGPPLARRGGPSGYLWQLQAATAEAGDSAHRLTFPPRETRSRPAAPARFARARALAGRIKRAVLGPPIFYRPAADDVERPGGVIDALMTASVQSMCADAEVSIRSALADDADVLFAHDPAVAERLLSVRRPGQPVWLFLHTPMPLSLYLSWTWVAPDWSWSAIAQTPDAARWTAWEIDVCARVDRLVVPCQEAFAELVRADGRFAALGMPDQVRTGAAAPRRRLADASRAELRRRWKLPPDRPVGLFLGSAQPYRGLDLLLEAMDRLPAGSNGLVAVAGPPDAAVRPHPRIRALGAVAEVGDLLHAVDFVINVNRFALFDLSAIEAAEAGRPLLLHAVGGNRHLDRLGAGCVMLRDVRPATIAAGLARLFEMSDEERRGLGAASRACYDRYLTLDQLRANHLALYDRAAAGAAATT